MRIIAHRGFAGAAPENTVAAARFAADRDADLIEIDTMPAADGTPVVFHDDRLDGRAGSRGITDASGPVYETPVEELAGVRIADTDEPIPTLADLQAALPADTGLNVELKRPGDPEPVRHRPPDGETPADRADGWEDFAGSVLAALDGFDGEVLFSSFAEGALAALRRRDPDATVAPIVAHDIEAGLERADRHGAAAVHPSLSALGVDDPVESGESAAVERCQAAGYRVNVWTVTTWWEARTIETLGVDGAITDYPGLFDWREFHRSPG